MHSVTSGRAVSLDMAAAMRDSAVTAASDVDSEMAGTLFML